MSILYVWSYSRSKSRLYLSYTFILFIITYNNIEVNFQPGIFTLNTNYKHIELIKQTNLAFYLWLILSFWLYLFCLYFHFALMKHLHQLSSNQQLRLAFLFIIAFSLIWFCFIFFSLLFLIISFQWKIQDLFVLAIFFFA